MFLPIYILDRKRVYIGNLYIIKMKYENVFFDLDDTLWNFTENAYDSFNEVYIQHRLGRYFDSFDHFYTLYSECNKRLWIEYGNGEITKDELNKQRFYYPLQSIGVFDEELSRKYAADFFELIPTKAKLIPNAKELLEYLSPKYRLFILSNGFKELQYRKMKAAGIDRYFEKVILSDDIQIHKPSPEIFQFALFTTKSTVANSVMVGDSWDADIVGAKGVNMDQVYFNNLFQGDFQFTPTYSIRDLIEIKQIL